MKKYWIIGLACSLLSPGLWAQAGMKINSGTQLVVSDNPSLVLHSTSWVNHGTFIAANSTAYFSGSTTDSVTGNSATSFRQLVLNKPTGALVLGQASQVDDTLQFVAGNLNLNGRILTLGTADGVLVGESENSRVIGPAGGEVMKTLNLNAPTSVNPGNLGCTLTSSANLGLTTIRRGHTPQALPGANSIQRVYRISPSMNTGLNATLRIAYFDAELNGLNENFLESWHHEGTNWINYSPASTDVSNNYVELNLDTLGRVTLGEGALKLSLKVYLQGSYAGGQMGDNLRANGLLPTSEPYSGLGYSQIGGGGETVSASLLGQGGNDAIVDWVFIELRSKSDSSMVLRTQSGLIQADGDIVGLDGKSALNFAGMVEDEYFLTLRHRNHLGIRSPGLMTLSRIETSHDFSAALSQAWANPAITTNAAMVDLGGGVFGLFRGDANGNEILNVVDFILSRNNSTPNQSNVYDPGDLNLDGNINVVDFLIGKAQSSPNKTGHVHN